MFKFLMRKGFGSVGETVRTILGYLKNFNVERNINIEEVRGIYAILIGQRASAANMAGQNSYNLLYDHPIPEFFDRIESFFGSNKLQNKDISIFCFLVIYLESQRKREGFREASESMRRTSFEVIFEEAYKICPNLCFFDKEESIKNMTTFYNSLEQLISITDKLKY
jgi:hypothetical protein